MNGEPLDNLEKVDLGGFARRMASADPRARAQTLDSIRNAHKRHIQAKELLGILIDSLHKENDPQIISRLTKMIGKLGNSSVIPVVREFLWSEDLRIVANTLEGLSHIYSLDIVPLVQPFLTSPDNRIKANAARALYNMNASLALEKLNEMVKSSELFFRDSGTYILGSIGDEKCLEMLIEVLQSENDSEILKKAIAALSNKGDERTLAALRKVSLSGVEGFRARAFEGVIAAVAARVEPSGPPPADETATLDVEELHQAIAQGTPAEKARALHRLADIGTAASLALIRAATNDAETSVRYAAKKALHAVERRLSAERRDAAEPPRPQAARPRAAEPVPDASPRPVGGRVMETPDAAPRIEEIDMVFLVLDLNNDDPKIRADAVSKLLYADRDTSGAAEALKYLVERLNVEPDPIVKSQIVRVIGKLGDESVIRLLKRILDDPKSDFRIKANAVEGLGYQGSPEAFRVITPYLSDSDNRIKGNAVIAAWKFDRDRTFKILSDMIHSADVTMRDSAAYSLLVLKPRDEAVLGLVREAFIREIEPDVIRKFADCLALLGDERTLDDFRTMVNHTSDLKRPYLQDVIGRLVAKFDAASDLAEASRQALREQPAFDFEEEYREATAPAPAERERVARVIDAAPPRPALVDNGEGTAIPLRALEFHLLEFNHPDERVRLNAIAAIAHYLTTGLPERLFGQVDMLLSLALNDSSLRVRKVAFDEYQRLQRKDYTLVREGER